MTRLAVDPDFFGALYNKGFAYYSKAGDYNKQIGQTDYTNKAPHRRALKKASSTT